MDYHLQEFAADLDRAIDKWKALIDKSSGDIEVLQLTYEALRNQREDAEERLLALRDAWCKHFAPTTSALNIETPAAQRWAPAASGKFRSPGGGSFCY